MTHHYVAGEGALWTQPNGPNTQPVYLGCHQIGDIDEPRGDVELIYCPDPSGPSRFRVVNSLQGTPGAVTTSITTDITDELDYLERAKCTMPIYVHLVRSGVKNVFTNYDRSFVLTNARVTSRGLTALTARTPDDNSRSEQSFELSAEALIRAVRLELLRQDTTNIAQAINDITFCNMDTCDTTDEVRMDACQIGYAVCDAPAGSPATTAAVFRTSNGLTWGDAGADPFAAGVNITGVECFEMGRDTTRVIVSSGASGTSDHVAFSDDNGANWTKATLPTVAAMSVPSSNSLFAFSRALLLAGTSTQRIYKSVDGGASWYNVMTLSSNTNAINAIHMANDEDGWAGGAGGVLYRTLDGGETWAAITGPSGVTQAINTVFAFDRNKVWVGYANGALYFTRDGGSTWTQRTFAGSGTGSVTDIKFMNEYVGILVRNSAAPVGTVLTTIDGGYTWETMTTPTNAGLNAAYMCHEHSFYVAGEVQNSTGYIAKAGV